MTPPRCGRRSRRTSRPALDGVLVAVNPAPERGLASSLRLGLAAATAAPAPGRRADPPRRPAAGPPAVIRALVVAAARRRPARVAVAPRVCGRRCAEPGPRPPAGVVAGRGARGRPRSRPAPCGRPDRVVRVPVGRGQPRRRHARRPGRAGGRRPGGPHDPTARSGPPPRPPGALASGPTTSRPHASARRRGRRLLRAGSRLFIADPRRTDDEVLDHLLPLARPGETWLDIGAGAGPLRAPARPAGPRGDRARPVAGDAGAPWPSRRRSTGSPTSGRSRPAGRWTRRPGPSPTADVALIANLGYDVEAIGPFLDAMEAAAGRLCVAILADGPPSRPAHAFWPLVHGEERIELPALDDFVGLLRARGRRAMVVRLPRPARGFPTRDELARWLRNQLFVEPGYRKGRRSLRASSTAGSWTDRTARSGSRRSRGRPPASSTWEPA